MQPTLSVSAIIDCYNSEQYIQEAIESVLAQQRRPDEFIIVDDGSSDDTAKIARNLIQDIPWARLIEKENGGQLSCMTAGIVEAKGDLLAFLDGDDIWKTNHLVEAEKQFQAEPKLSLFYGPYDEIGDCSDFKCRAYCHGLIGQTLVLTAAGQSYVGGVNATLVAKSSALKPYLPLPPQIEKDWVVNADNIIVWITSLTGGLKYAASEATVNYRMHPNNNYKKLSSHQPRAFRKSATARLFEYFERTFYLPSDLVRHLPQEYRAQPNKTKNLRKEYLRALKKSRGRVCSLMAFNCYVRLLFGF